MKKTAIAAILLVATSVPGLCAGYDDLNVAISYFHQDRQDDAIIWFTKAIQDGDLIPDQTRVAHLDRGMAYDAKGDAQNALVDYTAAIAAQPQDSLAYLQRASTYIALGEFDHAYADYDALVKLRPYDHDIRTTFGRMSWQAGQFERVVLAFQDFAKLRTEDWLWLQLANVKLGKSIDAFDPTDDISNTDTGQYANPSVMEAAKRWPNPMARFFKGEVTEQDAISAAPDGRHCQAEVYASLWHVAHGEYRLAEPLLISAQKMCRKTSEYWRIAQAELVKARREVAK